MSCNSRRVVAIREPIEFRGSISQSELRRLRLTAQFAIGILESFTLKLAAVEEQAHTGSTIEKGSESLGLIRKQVQDTLAKISTTHPQAKVLRMTGTRVSQKGRN